MSQETVQPIPVEQRGLTPEQEQTAIELTESVKVASEGLHRAHAEKSSFKEAELHGGTFAGLNLPGIAYVNADVGVNKVLLKGAEKKAKAHYKDNETAYQAQAVIDAGKDGIDIKGWNDSNDPRLKTDINNHNYWDGRPQPKGVVAKYRATRKAKREIQRRQEDYRHELDDFWRQQREHLVDDYSDDVGVVHCGLLADEIAGLLKKVSKAPLLVHLTGVVIDDAGNTKTLVPLAYGGDVTWGGHCVCLSEGLVYDPILEEPEPVGTYAIKAFGEDVRVARVTPA